MCCGNTALPPGKNPFAVKINNNKIIIKNNIHAYKQPLYEHWDKKVLLDEI
jgi:hypothetical protein